MRFFVDQTLGNLIKWLRLLGLDVVQIRLTHRDFKSLPAPKRDNFIITRQTSLPKNFSRADLINLDSDLLEEQLTEICRRLDLSPETWKPLVRCSKCNRLLQPIPFEQAEGRVPDYINQKQRQFFECPQCRRVFWEGSHQIRIRRRLQELQEHILAH
jgi:uncharacterized protein with PIN domain